MSLSIKRLCIFTIIILPMFISNVIAGELQIPNDKALIKFDTRIGIITFAHKKHADLSITKCTTCHHDLVPEGANPDTHVVPENTTVKACHECHLYKSKTPAKAKTAFHSRCTGCHEYTAAGGQKAGPLKTKCKLCHVKSEEDD